VTDADLEAAVESWHVSHASAGVTDAAGSETLVGDPLWQVRIASVSKLLVAHVALIALEEGSIRLEDPAGPTGATVGDLLAHSSGLAFDSPAVIAPPRQRRIYSNHGIEQFASHLASATGMSFDEYLTLGLLQPLNMATTELRGSPAHDIWSTVGDLLVFCRELLAPTLVAPATVAMATQPRHAELGGMLPGVGRMDPNPWGLGFEVKGEKTPHWTGTMNSPNTYGHFGGSGTFLWIDPVAGLGCVALTDRDFGPWALEVWPDFSDMVLASRS
jgi:CubicO group peptidase (beta-lactamase class C family)